MAKNPLSALKKHLKDGALIQSITLEIRRSPEDTSPITIRLPDDQADVVAPPPAALDCHTLSTQLDQACARVIRHILKVEPTANLHHLEKIVQDLLASNKGRYARSYEQSNSVEALSGRSDYLYAAGIAFFYCHEGRLSVDEGDLNHAWHCLCAAERWADLENVLNQRKKDRVENAAQGGFAKATKNYGWIKEELIRRLSLRSWPNMTVATTKLSGGMLAYIKEHDSQHPLACEKHDLVRSIYELMCNDPEVRAAFKKEKAPDKKT